MREIEPTERTRVKRIPKRAHYERATIEAILDEGLVCHVGFVANGQPYVIPMNYGCVGDRLYLHGSPASRLLQTLRSGVPACVTVTLLDGLVLARSAFHHSMNYRSVVLLGVPVAVEDPAEKLEALEAIVKHVVPGRWPDVRWPTEVEMKATLVLRLPIEEASAKIRTGPPVDDEEDYRLSCWAGEIPLRLVPQAPVPDPRLDPRILPPASVRDYRRPSRR
jgi:nitroimidazol reductase NimA-like FMN-containing flavoprotein (pyridoxamine 5'-phosphate oxidase superfamily)